MEGLVAGLNGFDEWQKAKESLKLPGIQERKGPIMAETRNAAILTELQNFLILCQVPSPKVIPAAVLLSWSLEFENKWLWHRVMTRLMMETARGGYLNNQVKDVLIADTQRKERMEGLATLAKMGPAPQQPSNPQGGQ